MPHATAKDQGYSERRHRAAAVACVRVLTAANLRFQISDFKSEVGK